MSALLASALSFGAVGCVDEEWVPDENGGGGEGIGTSPSVQPPTPPAPMGKAPPEAPEPVVGCVTHPGAAPAPGTAAEGAPTAPATAPCADAPAAAIAPETR